MHRSQNIDAKQMHGCSVQGEEGRRQGLEAELSTWDLSELWVQTRVQPENSTGAQSFRPDPLESGEPRKCLEASL